MSVVEKPNASRLYVFITSKKIKVLIVLDLILLRGVNPSADLGQRKTTKSNPGHTPLNSKASQHKALFPPSLFSVEITDNCDFMICTYVDEHDWHSSIYKYKASL
jgi:hypothetical protein